MNGINGSSLFENMGLFNQGVNKDTAAKAAGMPGQVSGTGNKKTDKAQSKSAMQDTVELNSNASKTQKAGYDRPAMQVQSQQTTPKQVDADGVQEGVELSDDAKALLDKLKEKYGNMDFYIAETDSDEEASYYLNQGQKQYSVLIDPETLEKMATDEDVLASYEKVLDGTDEMFSSIKDSIGEENMQYISSVNITFDKEGNKSYLVELINDFGKAQKNQSAQKNQNTQKKQNHKAEQADSKKYADKAQNASGKDSQIVRVKSDTVEDLITKIQDAIKQMKADTAKRQEEQTGQNTANAEYRQETVKKYQEVTASYSSVTKTSEFFS